MFFSPCFSARVREVSSVFIIIATLLSLRKLDMPYSGRVSTALACLFFIAFVFDFYRLHKDLDNLNEQIDARAVLIHQAKNAGLDSLEVRNVEVSGAKINLNDNGEWAEAMLSRYYGMEITVK